MNSKEKEKYRDLLKKIDENASKVLPQDEYDDFVKLGKEFERCEKENHDSALDLLELRLKEEKPDEYLKMEKLSGQERREFLEEQWSQLFRPIKPEIIENVRNGISPCISQALMKDGFPYELMKHQTKGGIGDPGKLIVREKMAIKETPISTEEENSMKAMDAFKTVVEGAYRWHIEIVTYALIINGKIHDSIMIGRGKNKRVPSSLDEISKIDLGKLIEFLEAQGLQVITNACDKTLRNASAHDHYKSYPDGSVEYWDRNHLKKKISLSDLNIIIDDLIDVNYSMTEAIKFSLGEVFGFSIKESDG